MDPIDVDEIAEVNFLDPDQSVEVTFKDGSKKIYSGEDLPDAMAVLNHWTPPTA